MLYEFCVLGYISRRGEVSSPDTKITANSVKLRKILFFIFTLLLTLCALISAAFAQYPAHTQFSLPEGAKVRLGKGTIWEIAYSPDGNLFAVAGSAGIWLYDTETYQERAFLTGQRGEVTSISWSGDSRLLASASDNSVCLWDTATATLKINLTEHHGEHMAPDLVAFSTDSTFLVSSDFHGIRLWDVKTATLKATLKEPGHRETVGSISLSGDARLLASGSWHEDTIQIWDVKTATLKATLPGFGPGEKNVSLNPDGTRLAAGGTTKDGYYALFLWDVENITQIAVFKRVETPGGGYSGSPVGSISWSPDGRILASERDGILWLRDTTNATPTLKATFSAHTESVESLSWSPDGTRLATGSSDVRLWDVQNTTLKTTLTGYTGRQGYTGSVTSLSLNADGTRLASAIWTNTVHLWDVPTATQIATLRTTPTPSWEQVVRSVSLNPEGTLLATGEADGLRLWDLTENARPSRASENRVLDQKSTKEIGLLTKKISDRSPSGRRIRSVSWSADGTHLASGSEHGTVRLWDFTDTTPTLKATLIGHREEVRSVALNADGTCLASASRGDYALRLWDVENRTEKVIFTELPFDYHGHGISLSADGTRLASTNWRNETHLWDLTRAKPTPIFTGISSNCVSLNSDGTILASGDRYGKVSLWDVPTLMAIPKVPFTEDKALPFSVIAEAFVKVSVILKLIDAHKATFTGHADTISSLSWSADSALLASGSADGTVLLWDVDALQHPKTDN